MKNSYKAAFLAVLTGLVILDFFVPRHHEFFPWDKVSGFSAVLGLVAGGAIIFISRAYSAIGVRKKEEYYDKSNLFGGW